MALTSVVPHRKTRPTTAVVIEPIAKRLTRIEALLLEMRHEQDLKLKRIGKLQEQVEALTERVSGNRGSLLQLLARGQKALRR